MKIKTRFYFALSSLIRNFAETNPNSMMKNTGRIVVVGSANTDLVISTCRFPQPGETIAGHGFMSNRGGKGANQAVAAARLGAEVAFVGKLGRDVYGEQTLEALAREGISTEGVSRTAAAPSGIAVITVDANGENTIIVDGGANNLLSAEDIAAAEGLFSDAAIVLMQLETPVEALLAAAQTAHRHGALVVLNPAPAPSGGLPEELLHAVDLLIPNQTEAALLSGMGADDVESACRAAEDLCRRGAGRVIITMGSQGALVDGRLVKSYPTTVVDTTAAGDTFCGALCARLAAGDDLATAADYACRAAAFTVSRKGAQQAMPTQKDLVSRC